jgi:GT2 family glycosyltransferase
VSVVVPAFNETPDVVRASLESLRAQSFTDFECIVIDESTLAERARACREVCEEDPRFVYVHPAQRLGLSRSLNLGIERARGEFIARFDSDDVCVPDRLARQVAFLELHGHVGIVGGGLEIIDEEGRTLAFRDYPLPHAEIARGMHTTTAVAHPTVMFRHRLAALHGVYNPEFRYSEDLDLWLRWMNAGVVFANLPGVLVRYRQKHTRRSPQHWRYNLRARTRNFAAQHLLRRVLGIGGIAVWIALPSSVQETVFRSLVLRRQPGHTQP